MIPSVGLSIITGPKCAGCIKLKNMLKQLDVEFIEVSILTVPKIARSGIPQIYVNGKMEFKGTMSTIYGLKDFLKSHEIKYKEE